VRQIQFSTAFAEYNPTDYPPGLPADFWRLPDDRRQWQAACDVFTSLQHLQYARVTIITISQLNPYSSPTNTDLLVEVLQPLKAVRAVKYVVEIAAPVGVVRARLGTTLFSVHERGPPVCSGEGSSRDFQVLTVR